MDNFDQFSGWSTGGTGGTVSLFDAPGVAEFGWNSQAVLDMMAHEARIALAQQEGDKGGCLDDISYLDLSAAFDDSTVTADCMVSQDPSARKLNTSEDEVG